MLDTTQELYNFFLKGIRKEKIATVRPEEFNIIINYAQYLWRSNKVRDIELGQKRIDDLDILKVITDEVYTYNGSELSYIDITENQFDIPDGSSYPSYWRMSSLSVAVAYNNNKSLYNDYPEGNYFIPATLLPEIEKYYVLRSPYKKDNHKRVYYQQKGNKIFIICTESPLKAKMEYYRLPVRIWFDESNPSDHTNEGVDPYTAGYGSVNCELRQDQRQEIVDIAVRFYLERSTDPRYQTWLMEQAQKVT